MQWFYARGKKNTTLLWLYYCSLKKGFEMTMYQAVCQRATEKTGMWSLAFSGFFPLVSSCFMCFVGLSLFAALSLPQGPLDTFDPEKLLPSLDRCLHSCMSIALLALIAWLSGREKSCVSLWSLYLTLTNPVLPGFQLKPFLCNCTTRNLME